MKKLNLFLLVALLLTACGPAPQDVVHSWAEAMNAGDMDKALSYLAEDAVVTIVPAMEGDGVYNGHAEIRGWYEPLLSSKGVTTLSDCKTEGETVACLDTYADEGLKAMGVDSIEGDFAAVVRDGKIQSYTLTITPESLAKFPPPPTPDPSGESRASSVDELIGKWFYSQAGVVIIIRADGTYTVYAGADIADEGNYTFEAGKITWATAHISCSNRPATYEAYVTREDGKPVWLRLQVVGIDPCGDRRQTFAERARFRNP